jgi:hypothetical protein
MNRRMVVESANAALKGGFVDLSRGYFRVFGLTKINLFLGFTVAAYNLDRVASFLRKKRAHLPRTASKRRLGTWSILLADKSVPEELGSSPPG